VKDGRDRLLFLPIYSVFLQAATPGVTKQVSSIQVEGSVSPCFSI
jgi:hypothetical protein